jgi:hypothetical protein
MKNIDIKSLIIGALLTSTIIFGMGATGKADKNSWDDEQEWAVAYRLKKAFKQMPLGKGVQPFAVTRDDEGVRVWVRKRIK